MARIKQDYVDSNLCLESVRSCLPNLTLWLRVTEISTCEENSMHYSEGKLVLMVHNGTRTSSQKLLAPHLDPFIFDV